MADVLIVCVREDELQAKALADMFERAGFSVGGAPASDGALRSTGAGVVVWSQASIRSRPFLDAAQRVIDANKAVVASLIDPPPPHTINNAPAFALAGWSGDPEDAALDPLFFAVDRMVTSQRAAVGATPARPAAGTFEEPPSLRPPPAYGGRLRSDAAPPSNRPPQPRSRAPEARGEDLGAEAEHWRAIRDSRDPTDFMDYLARYGPNGAFSEVAEIKLKQLTGPSTPPPSSGSLRDAVKSAQPAPYQRSRRLEPPPAPARLDTPPRRLEPIAPPPPPPPPRRADPPPPPRRDPPPPPAYRREYERPAPAEVRDDSARRGGLVRLLILALLIGAGAFGANYFLNQQPSSEQVAEAPNEDLPPSDVVSNAPLPGADGLGGVDVADEPVQLERTTLERAAPPPPRQEAQRRPQPQPAAQAREEDAPPPAPRTSWDNQPAAADPSGAPASLLPNAPPQLQPAPQVFASATPRPTPEPAPSTITRTPPGEVVFTQRPSARRIADLYPARAMRDEVGGRVQLDCVIRGDMALSCAITSESPAGMGFGSAALAAANGYRAQSTLTNGQTSAGSRARLVIVFQPPE